MSSRSVKRAHVVIDPATHEQLKAYAELTGKTITAVAAEAIKDWMETIGAARLEALTSVPEPKTLMMPSAVKRAQVAAVGTA